METVLQTYGLTKQYGSFTALSNLDLALERGKIIGLLGPNGSGKTTFMWTYKTYGRGYTHMRNAYWRGN